MGRTKVLVVDDHPLVCQGLRTMLEPEYLVVGTVHDGAGVMGAVDQLRPELVVLDLSLPGKSGTAVLIELMARPHPPAVVVLTMHADHVLADFLLTLGARAFVPKDTAVGELQLAIAAVLQGRTYVPEQLRELPHPERGRFPSGYLTLTSREQQVVQMIGLGLNNDRIAGQLRVSYRTVHFHRSNIRRKLGFHSDWDMTRFALEVRACTDGADSAR